MLAGWSPWTARRHRLGEVDAKHLPGHPHFAQVLDDARRQALGELHQTVLLQHTDAADLTGLQARLIGNGPHQVAGLGAVGFTHLHPEGLKAGRPGSGSIA